MTDISIPFISLCFLLLLQHLQLLAHFSSATRTPTSPCVFWGGRWVLRVLQV